MKPKTFEVGTTLTLLSHKTISKFPDGQVTEREINHRYKEVPRAIMQADCKRVYLGDYYSELEYPLKSEYSEESIDDDTGTFKIEYEVCPGVRSVLHYHYKLKGHST